MKKIGFLGVTCIIVGVLIFGLVRTKRVSIDTSTDQYYLGYSYIEGTGYFCALRVYEDPSQEGLFYSYVSNLPFGRKGNVDYIDENTIQGSYTIIGPHNEVYNGVIQIDKREKG